MTSQQRRQPTNRIVPVVLRPMHEQHIRRLLEQDEFWVARDVWRRWLDSGDDALTTPIAGMNRDERIAAAAWVSQQKHLLHAVVAGNGTAPDGWAGSLTLTRALLDGTGITDPAL